MKRFKHSFQLFAAALLCAAFVSGCQTLAPETTSPTPGAQPPSPDLIWQGDKLIITFSDLPSPQPPFEVTVGEGGEVTLLENKRIKVAGKTKGQLEEEIRKLYVPGYYQRLTVTVTAPDRYFSVLGEVKSPGPRPYIGNMSVLKAVAAAGGFTEFATKTVEITRANQKKERVNTKKAQKHPSLDLPIYPGDLIVAPRRVL